MAKQKREQARFQTSESLLDSCLPPTHNLLVKLANEGGRAERFVTGFFLSFKQAMYQRHVQYRSQKERKTEQHMQRNVLVYHGSCWSERGIVRLGKSRVGPAYALNRAKSSKRSELSTISTANLGLSFCSLTSVSSTSIYVASVVSVFCW